MRFKLTVLMFFFLCGNYIANAQQSTTETEIRRLEKLQCDAIVQHDSVALYKLWAEDFTVNSPTNDVVKLDGAKFAIRNGFIDYSLFETKLEDILVLKDIVITMGSETIKPIGKAQMVGQTLQRRYTQVWMKRNGAWQLVARHANLVTDLVRPATEK